MKKNDCVIVIPIYKQSPSESEKASFRQSCQVLSDRPICIVTHSKLDISWYLNTAKEWHVNPQRVDFDELYFEGIEGYNKLCLSVRFYKRFNSYKYMLIYQLDAYIFNDRLDYWCSQGYDYVGAPWSELKCNSIFGLVGNGGFSLRRNKTFIRILHHRGPLFSIRYNFQKYYKGTWISWWVFIGHCLGYKSTLRYYLKQGINEDALLFLELRDSKIKIYTPSPIEAGLFAFEHIPSKMYDYYGVLPMGCHAWPKIEYESFWKQYISLTDSSAENDVKD